MYLCNKVHHDDMIPWKHFHYYWPFVRRIHGSPVNSIHKGPLMWKGFPCNDDVIIWKQFAHYWPFVWGIHQWPVDSPYIGPLMCKGFPCHDDVIIWKQFAHCWPFVWGIHQWPVDSPHIGPVMWKAFPSHDLIMWCLGVLPVGANGMFSCVLCSIMPYTILVYRSTHTIY